MVRWTSRDQSALPQRLGGLAAGWCLGLAMLFGSAAVLADPPGRVGRIAVAEGQVQLTPVSDETGQAGVPVDQPRNWPVTTGDVLAVGDGSRAEITVGSTRLRLGARSRLVVLKLDDDELRLQLLDGSLALRLRTDDNARGTEVLAGVYRMRPLGAGLFRFDAEPGAVGATAWRQEIRIDSPNSTVSLRSGQKLKLDAQGSRWQFMPPESDRFAAWAMNDSEPVAAGPTYVSPEMTGHEDLAQYGDWQTSPEWGTVWIPRAVSAEWAPYRQGRWSWVAPWGWTWVDAAPWGFAPFHYGRWVMWRQRWVWAPGSYDPSPAYAPALVAWAGSGGSGVSITIGSPAGRAYGPPPGWYPLAPQQRYEPGYRGSREYWERLNRPHLPNHARHENVPMPAPPRGFAPGAPHRGVDQPEPRYGNGNGTGNGFGNNFGNNNGSPGRRPDWRADGRPDDIRDNSRDNNRDDERRRIPGQPQRGFVAAPAASAPQVMERPVDRGFEEQRRRIPEQGRQFSPPAVVAVPQPAPAPQFQAPAQPQAPQRNVLPAPPQPAIVAPPAQIRIPAPAGRRDDRLEEPRVQPGARPDERRGQRSVL